ncbi:hypothetical protein [Parabacteroides goldsteinii]|uniref:hypothetical protein n=1 Tax=Parabacteroides goldsteinii TaxID=328812 RepID=UPI0024931218|nr:hypothetical protein [Parabacteroides goldsteinii]
MKKKFIHTLQFILAVLFMIHTATLYAQVSVVRKEKGFEVKDSLIVNQSFDRERKVLTLEIKNGFDYKILIKNPSAVSSFLLEYVTEDGEKRHYPYPFSLSDTARVFWLKPDSTLVVNYNWGAHLMATTKQIVLKGYFLYSIIDDNNNSRAIHEYVFEEKRFDY